MRTTQAGIAYFALVFGTGFLLGIIRVPFLVPRLGVRTAELIEMPFMFVAILFAARYVVRRFALKAASASPPDCSRSRSSLRPNLRSPPSFRTNRSPPTSRAATPSPAAST